MAKKAALAAAVEIVLAKKIWPEEEDGVSATRELVLPGSADSGVPVAPWPLEIVVWTVAPEKAAESYRLEEAAAQERVAATNVWKPVAEAAGLATAQVKPVARDDSAKRASLLLRSPANQHVVLGKRGRLPVELEESAIHVPVKPGFGERRGFSRTAENLPREQEDWMVLKMLEKEHGSSKRADPHCLEDCWEVRAVGRCY